MHALHPLVEWELNSGKSDNVIAGEHASYQHS